MVYYLYKRTKTWYISFGLIKSIKLKIKQTQKENNKHHFEIKYKTDKAEKNETTDN